MARKLELITEFEVLEAHEADKDMQALLTAAREAGAKAYAPYSHFLVGAAVMLTDGTIIIGSNQENAAYPSGICAERSAIFYTGSAHPGKEIKMIAVAAKPEHAPDYLTASPCGACRQAMLEYEDKQHKDIKLLLQGRGGQVFISASVANLLPFKFDAAALEGAGVMPETAEVKITA
ncbi:MAG: cytidine deaminase [Bacteroidota bacterium]